MQTTDSSTCFKSRRYGPTSEIRRTPGPQRADPEGRLAYAGRAGTGISHAELERAVAPPVTAGDAQDAA